MPPATPPTPISAHDAPQQPRSRADLFWSFSWLALQGFGGVLAVVQREVVERKQWLTREQFVEEWAVAQILPGPNVINLALMLGGRHFGLSGALAAMAGMLCFPLLVILVMAVAFASVADHPMALGALRGMGAVAAGLIAATGLKLIPALRQNVMGHTACWVLGTLMFVGIAWLRWPLAWVLLDLGVVACAWAWCCLGRVVSTQQP